MKFSKVLIIALLPLSVFAKSPQFTNIDDADMKVIANAMGSNFTHSSLMGASKLGTVFGFQAGVFVASTDTSKLNTLVKENAGAELKNLYNAGLMGAVGIPFGISFEATVVPTLKNNSSSLDSSSAAIKWNINDVIPVLPVNLALRGVTSNANFSFNQTVSGTTAKISNETSVTGVQLLFSPMIPVIEPYIGVGALSSEDTLKGPAGIFTGGVTKMTKKVTGTQTLAGVEVNLLLLKLGLEYSNAFDNSRVAFKLSFGF